MVLPNTKPSLTRRDWVAEHARLTAADQESGLAAEDLERLAVAAHLLGEDERVVTLRDRAYQEYLARGMPAEAARCVFWVGFHLANAGQGAGPAAGSPDSTDRRGSRSHRTDVGAALDAAGGPTHAGR